MTGSLRGAGLALLLAGLATPALASGDATLAAAIDRAAQAAVAAGESPGLQVAVYKDGKPVLVKGYGSANLELQVPVTNDSVFRIGSVTKQFTAVALLKLAEEGKLSLDDKLSKYYPDFPRAADISLAQMLHHTSGLHNYTEEKSFGHDGMTHRTTDEMATYFKAMSKTQDFEPGTSWHYSNTAYYLLGGVVEKVEGKPVATVFKERFFTPLGMTRTAMDDETEITPGRAAGYEAAGLGKFKNAAFLSMTAPGAAGAMRSSASDLARWNAALFGGKLLKPTSFKAMITPGKLGNGQLSGTAMPKGDADRGEYGYALAINTVDGHLKISHGGGIDGFNSSLAEFPNDKVTVAVIANTIGKENGAHLVAKRIERIAIGLPAEK